MWERYFSPGFARCLLHGLVRYLRSLPSRPTISLLRLEECVQLILPSNSGHAAK